MKLETIVLWGVVAVAGAVGVAYFAGLVFGVIHSGGLLLPALIVFAAVVALVIAVIRQRLANREDDYYDTIEK